MYSLSECITRLNQSRLSIIESLNLSGLLDFNISISSTLSQISGAINGLEISTDESQSVAAE
jgi:hypothetical protein